MRLYNKQVITANTNKNLRPICGAATIPENPVHRPALWALKLNSSNRSNGLPDVLAMGAIRLTGEMGHPVFTFLGEGNYCHATRYSTGNRV